MCINEIFHRNRPIWSVSVTLQHPCSGSFPVKVHDNVLSMKKIYSLLWTLMWLRPTFKFGQSVSCCLMTRGSSELHVIVVWGLARQNSCNVTSFEKKYLPSSVTSCKSKEKLNVLICQSPQWRNNFHFIMHTLRDMWSSVQVVQCGIALPFFEVFATKNFTAC